MRLSLDEAATRLGKTTHQLRYLIKTGRLQASKVAGRWQLESSALPLSEGQQKAVARRQRQLRAAVEEGLGLAGSERPPRYSVRDLKAFQIALPVYDKARSALGGEHPAVVSLRQVLVLLSRGCHRYDRADKAEAYRQARDAASLAVCELLLAEASVGAALVQQIEQELMAAFAGLLRRCEAKRSR